ncbi:MAG: bidirectional hydrogenase complex protein HoxU [Kiritimatiellae bacterium]|nr:bidirectional hydrogenase complex protein HoxU [Kiritimatiellia bacterium]MCO5062240.1 bidirectional hydrogenase complex protein HoxU [Kiritimatiellia bacterium]MCO5067204.1 bidirectional hydrogenase complex protein HoxU [Kiritimatiellia bacterium]MCO6399619.1 bidirectional hydrogenase complex protein HoxU [Verrucomicrobiota bacterium]
MSTPSRVITLTLDDREVGAHTDQTILEVARENGIVIPTLCHLEGLLPIGACRICLVEVVGSNKLLPACATKVTDGMRVITQSERLTRYRRRVVEFLFASGNHICAVCVSNHHCELQDMAVYTGMSHLTEPYRYPKLRVDASHERFVQDDNRCILCQRCVRVCAEIEGAHTWDVMGRGIEARVITDLNQPWGESDTCTSCSKCVQVCPTGALSIKGMAAAEMKKRKHFLAQYWTLKEEES